MNKQLFSFSISNALFNLAYNIGKVFGVLYFYILFDRSLIAAVGGLVAVCFCHSFFLWCIARFLGRLGSRYSLIISMVLFFTSFLTISYITPANPLPYYLSWILLFSLARAFYFIPYHYFVLHFTEGQKRGEETGKLGAITGLASMFAPFIGGSLAGTWGVQGMALVSGVLFIVASIPLFKLPNYRFVYTGRLFDILKMPATRQDLKLVLINDTQNKETFWQIYVFIMLSGSFINFGALFTIVNLVCFVVLWFFGKVVDHENRKRLLHIDGVITAIAWGFRAIATTPVGAALSDTLYQTVTESRAHVLGVLDYDMLNRSKMEAMLDEKLIAREISWNVFSGLFTIICIALALVIDIKAVFVLAAIGALGLLTY